MKNSEVLERAADALDKYGWVRGARGSLLSGGKPSGMCILGALSYAVTGNPRSTAGGTNEVMDLIAREVGTSPISFNDMHAAGKKQVADVLRRAARKARAREVDGARPAAS